jgi:hypothetical protein
MGASAAMIAGVEVLWRIPRPGPKNLLSSFTGGLGCRRCRHHSECLRETSPAELPRES